MESSLWLHAALLLAVAVAASAYTDRPSDTSNDLTVLRGRLQQSYLADCSQLCGDAVLYASTLSPDGSWPDVDYKDQTRTVWKAMVHWYRMNSISGGYGCVECRPGVRNSSTLLSAFHDAFGFWAAHDFQNPNWWFNDIGYRSACHLSHAGAFTTHPACHQRRPTARLAARFIISFVFSLDASVCAGSRLSTSHSQVPSAAIPQCGGHGV